MTFLVTFAMKQNHILTNIVTLDLAYLCVSGSGVKGDCKHHLVPDRQEGGVIEYRKKRTLFIIVKGADQNLGFSLHLNFQGWVAVDVFFLDSKAKAGAQSFENIIGAGSSQFLAEKVLDIMLGV